MMEVGMASPAIKTARQLRMKSKTTRLASKLPRMRCSIRELTEALMNSEMSRTTTSSTPPGTSLLKPASRCLTASAPPLRHVGDAGGRPAATGDDDVGKLFGRGHAPQRAQTELFGAMNNAATWRFDVFALHGLANIEHAQVVRGQPLAIDQEADFAALAPIEADFAHPRDGLQSPAHLLVGNLGELAPAHRPRRPFRGCPGRPPRCCAQEQRCR